MAVRVHAEATFRMSDAAKIDVFVTDQTRERIAEPLRVEGNAFFDHAKTLTRFAQDVQAYAKSVDMTDLERSRVLNAIEAGRYACRLHAQNLYHVAERYVAMPAIPEVDDDPALD